MTASSPISGAHHSQAEARGPWSEWTVEFSQALSKRRGLWSVRGPEWALALLTCCIGARGEQGSWMASRRWLAACKGRAVGRALRDVCVRAGLTAAATQCDLPITPTRRSPPLWHRLLSGPSILVLSGCPPDRQARPSLPRGRSWGTPAPCHLPPADGFTCRAVRNHVLGGPHLFMVLLQVSVLGHFVLIDQLS